MSRDVIITKETIHLNKISCWVVIDLTFREKEYPANSHWRGEGHMIYDLGDGPERPGMQGASLAAAA